MSAQATATGTLGGTPIGNLLIYALDRRLSGTIVIEDHRARKCAISLRAGAPVKVKLPEPVALLSEVLVGLGAIDTAQAADLYATAQRESRLFGSVLLERTEVDGSVLGDALGEQVKRKAEWLATLRPESVYGYYDGQDFLREFGPPEGAEVDGLAVIWRVLRSHADLDVATATLARLGTRDVRLHTRSRVGRFGFDPKERGIVDVLRAKPQSIPSLVQTGILPEEKLKRVLYALVVTRHVDLGSGTAPIGIEGSGPSLAPPGASSSPPVPSVAPVRSTSAVPAQPPAQPKAVASAPPPQLAELKAEIEERLKVLGKKNYYEILGIDPKAPTPSVQMAFFQLAKKWHPDRIPGDLGALREGAVRIFASMTEAHQMLSNEEQRREYDRLMLEGGATADEQEEVRRVLRAAAAFQKAEVLARRGNRDEAEVNAALAVENDPDQAEYVALYAELISQREEASRSGNYQAVIKMVNEAKKKQPDNIRVLMHRARVLRRAGDLDAAYAEFRAIAQRDANNVEAAREVRLHQMRRGKTTTNDPRKSGSKEKPRGGKEPPKDALGMFGKFFKR